MPSLIATENSTTLADDVLDGLTRPFKELPPKHLYDARGADLFDQICDLPEYYPTRTERSILVQRACDIAQRTGAEEVVELGSGTAAKTRILLDALHAAGTLRRYVPIDVTEGMISDCETELAATYPGLAVHGIVGDFECHLEHVPPPTGPRLVLLLGGTIGNFTPGRRRGFLRAIAGLLADGDHLLLGTDLVKDPAVIEAAYDDAAGVTAEFNLNMLEVINRELRADFDLDAFEHVAFFDREHEWIEMRLRATSPQTVQVADLDLTVHFAAREELRTEISAKFSRDRIDADFAAAGLEVVEQYVDDDDLFALNLARRV
jgi:L-histidine N-alpha-methyltransferase